MDRLTKSDIRNAFMYSSGLPSYEKIYEKLAHYEDLIEQGLIPLYYIGDSIYFRVKGMNQFGEHVDFIQTQKISNIDINEDGILYSTATEKFTNKDVGRKVFLTRKQAEFKLKELNNKE